MTVNLSPVGGAAAQFFDNNGNPLSGGKLYTYAAGTTTPLATYTTVVGDVAHTNPIILDSAGRVPSGQIWLTDLASYKVTIKTSADVLVGSYDGIIDSGVALVDALRADLVAPSGSSLVGYLPAGTGAVATTVQGKLREVISVLDFGATGDGVTDDTLAVQAALLAGAGQIVFFPAGTYLCTTIIIYSKTAMIGEGISATVIKAKSTLAGNAALLWNNIQTGTLNVYYDVGILIQGMTFDGNGLGTRTAELVSLGKVQNTTIRDCMVRNIGYIGLAFGGSNNVRILNCKFTTTGNPVVTAEGGASVWFGASPDATGTTNVLIDQCSFYALEWAGIYANCNRITISGCSFLNVKEAGIFSGSPNLGLIIEGCTINGVTRKYISASGIETGASNVTIVGNSISNVGSNCISLTDTQNVTISGNTLSECRQESVVFTDASGIAVITTVASPNQPRNITITGNTFSNLTVNAYAFVVVGNVGAAVLNVTVQNNNTDSTFTSGFGVFYQAGKRGNGCINRNNVGTADATPVIKQITRDMTAGPGAVATTGIGFRASKITLYAKIPGTIVQSIGVLATTPGHLVIYTTSAAGSDSINNTECVRLQTGSTPDRQLATGVIDEDGFTLTWAKAGNPTGTATIVVVAEA